MKSALNSLIFGKLFKKFRLKSEFSSLSDLGRALAKAGLIYEESAFSRWQSGNRIPADRNLLITLIIIFVKHGGIRSLHEANKFLDSAGHGYLTEKELEKLTKSTNAISNPNFPPKILEFLKVIGKSKKILRTGWVREKIKNPESVAAHSFRLSVIAMILADNLGLDKEKLVKMALLHDLGEVITGDIVWSRGNMIDVKKRTEKEDQERKGIEKVFKIIGNAHEYVKLFEEMIKRETNEARIFWELDKLEMAVQALEYEKDQSKKLDEFFLNADLQIRSPYLKKIMKKIFKQRLTN